VCTALKFSKHCSGILAHQISRWHFKLCRLNHESTSDNAIQSVLRSLLAETDQDLMDTPLEKHLLTRPGTSRFGDGAGSAELL
jgi:hypothetical protein